MPQKAFKIYDCSVSSQNRLESGPDLFNLNVFILEKLQILPRIRIQHPEKPLNRRFIRGFNVVNTTFAVTRPMCAVTRPM